MLESLLRFSCENEFLSVIGLLHYCIELLYFFFII
jgi:hypothetical protein